MGVVPVLREGRSGKQCQHGGTGQDMLRHLFL
jgi:hypothetical protein